MFCDKSALPVASYTGEIYTHIGVMHSKGVNKHSFKVLIHILSMDFYVE